MKLFILRHAEAIDAVDAASSMPDDWRYLTGKGRKTAEAFGRRMEKLAGTGLVIVSSPLVRAVQTAQIVADRIGRKCKVEINGMLRSGVDVADIVDFLQNLSSSENIMLVGHEPQLGELATVLLKSETALQLKKNGCIEIEINPAKPDKPAKFNSCMNPGKKRITSLKKACKS